MKFKKDAIKPGMVIHCPKEEDARVLLAHLKELRYNIQDTHPRIEWEQEIGEGIFYEIQSDDFWCWGRKRMGYFQAGRKITEFSDLIEPDDSPMTAVEVLEWLCNHYNDYNGKLFTEVFGADYTFNELLIEKKLSPMEIVRKITAYEAAKKTPKPVEVEWVDICRIIQIQDNGFKKCVYEEELDNHLIPFSEGDKFAMKSAEGILKKYISEHEGVSLQIRFPISRSITAN